MGNRKPVEAKKRKKKGRPSLLDLQKRSLRLQKQQQQEQPERPPSRNPNPNPNPYLKYPNRRSTRRNPNLTEDEEDGDGDEDDEEESNGKRKEKKLKLVSRIPNGSDLGESGSDSGADAEGSCKKRKIGAVKTGRQNSDSKATVQTLQEDPSDSGPTTPLPDKKLLVFILDRLQKKDTYGVFSEPVDPEELPDYHDIIEHPMDFGSVRKKLDSRAYENLEQFENDIFLISSNAMRYNASDTIYFRQARAIQELAKKDFENLRQESDDNEPEPKTARRGRPPIKNVMKRIARAPADRTGPDFSTDATLANARDETHSANLTRELSRRGPSFDKPSMESSLRSSHGSRVNSDHKSERCEEYSGPPLKGIPMRNWKKFSSIDENRRNTYFQPLQPTCTQEPSIITAFEREKKLLMPIGVYIEHAYVRSLARFAANLGPVGWQIAARRIERILPRGTKFGPGWVGDDKIPRQVPSPPVQSSQAKLPVSSGNKALDSDQQVPSNSETSFPPSTSSSIAPVASRPADSADSSGGGGNLMGGGSGSHPKIPLQPCQSQVRSSLNGFNPGFGLNLPTQSGKMSHPHLLPEMVPRRGNSNFANHQVRPLVGNSGSVKLGSPVSDPSCDSEGQWLGQSLNPKPGLVPPDLNVDFQSPTYPVSGAMLADSKPQQPQPPDLALQL